MTEKINSGNSKVRSTFCLFVVSHSFLEHHCKFEEGNPAMPDLQERFVCKITNGDGV